MKLSKRWRATVVSGIVGFAMALVACMVVPSGYPLKFLAFPILTFAFALASWIDYAPPKF